MLPLLEKENSTKFAIESTGGGGGAVFVKEGMWCDVLFLPEG